MRRVLVLFLALITLPFVCNGQTNGLPQGAVLNTVVREGPGAVHSFLIASLPPPDGNDWDHVHIAATLGGWFATQQSYVDIVFANRGFAYTWSNRGSGPLTTNQAKIVAYQDTTDQSVDIYMILGDGYVEGGYTILEAAEDTVYANPTDAGASTPSGTVVFDSSSPQYKPTSYTDFMGNSTLKGNVTLTAGSGAGITFQDGTTQATAYTGVACGGDYAESVNVDGEKIHYEPGDVLVIGAEGTSDVAKSSKPYSTMVAGIYSTKPGYVGRRQVGDPSKATTEVPMAMIGIVPTKVSDENGPIRRGDLLVSSSTLGYAMKGTDRSQMLGTVIGKALGNLDSGKGTIEVLVTLQ